VTVSIAVPSLIGWGARDPRKLKQTLELNKHAYFTVYAAAVRASDEYFLALQRELADALVEGVILVRAKPTAFGRATLEGSADPARKKYALPPGKPLGEEEERMHDFQSLAHVKWDCKYHVVFIPKYRRKVLYGKLRAAVGRILRELCDQKGI